VLWSSIVSGAREVPRCDCNNINITYLDHTAELAVSLWYILHQLVLHHQPTLYQCINFQLRH